MLRPVTHRLHSFGAVLSRAARSPALPLALLAGVAADDALAIPRAPSYAVLGLLDEPAHLATSGILLGAIVATARRLGRRVPPAFAAGLLAGGNLIDADHIPDVLGWDALTRGTPRPYPHSLLTVAVLAGVAVAAHRGGRRGAAAVSAGLATGVAGHLLRDLGTAPVALLWPISGHGMTIPHRLYLAVLGALAVTGALAQASRRRQPAGESS